MLVPRERNYEEDVTACLSLIKETGLTKRGWDNTKFWFENNWQVVLPPWNILAKEQRRMCPPLTVTEEEASFKMQDMEEYTVKRLLQRPDVRHKLTDQMELVLHSKAGFDGLSDMAVMNTSKNVKEDFINNMGMVPLRLVDSLSGVTLWENVRPGDILFYRPYPMCDGGGGHYGL